MIPIWDARRPISDSSGAMTDSFRYVIRLIIETLNKSCENAHEIVDSLSDDETYFLDPDKAGYGEVMIGDNQECARFRWSSDGAVTVTDQSTNVTASDVDGNLCIYDSGAGVAIKNRLGASLSLRATIHYM